MLYAVRSLHPTIRGGRSHLPHGANRTPHAKWLEESIATIAGLDPCCICLAATKADGTVFTGYYNADAADKAVFAHNIQSDIVMDIIKANADTISGILEDGK